MSTRDVWTVWMESAPWSACDRLDEVRRAVVGALAFSNRSDLADRVLAGDGRAALEAATLRFAPLPVDANSWGLTCNWLALHLDLSDADARRARLALAGQMVVMRELGAPGADQLAALAAAVMARRTPVVGRA